MAKENVKLFYEALAADKNLQNKVIKTNEKYNGQQIDKETFEQIFKKEFLPIAKEAGFDFTWEEFIEVMEENKDTKKISDDELVAVAGGTGNLDNTPVGGGWCMCTTFGYGIC